ncbi:MAG: hypothetical protein KDA96_22155 [Planctomycetaceae bacterium]|nr:hypothetical protein [Planctomycetaceae bacterium]
MWSVELMTGVTRSTNSASRGAESVTPGAEGIPDTESSSLQLPDVFEHFFLVYC